MAKSDTFRSAANAAGQLANFGVQLAQYGQKLDAAESTKKGNALSTYEQTWLRDFANNGANINSENLESSYNEFIGGGWAKGAAALAGCSEEEMQKFIEGKKGQAYVSSFNYSYNYTLQSITYAKTIAQAQEDIEFYAAQGHTLDEINAYAEKYWAEINKNLFGEVDEQGNIIEGTALLSKNDPRFAADLMDDKTRSAFLIKGIQANLAASSDALINGEITEEEYERRCAQDKADYARLMGYEGLSDEEIEEIISEGESEDAEEEGAELEAKERESAESEAAEENKGLLRQKPKTAQAQTQATTPKAEAPKAEEFDVKKETVRETMKQIGDLYEKGKSEKYNAAVKTIADKAQPYVTELNYKIYSGETLGTPEEILSQMADIIGAGARDKDGNYNPAFLQAMGDLFPTIDAYNKAQNQQLYSKVCSAYQEASLSDQGITRGDYVLYTSTGSRSLAEGEKASQFAIFNESILRNSDEGIVTRLGALAEDLAVRLGITDPEEIKELVGYLNEIDATLNPSKTNSLANGGSTDSNYGQIQSPGAAAILAMITGDAEGGYKMDSEIKSAIEKARFSKDPNVELKPGESEALLNLLEKRPQASLYTNKQIQDNFNSYAVFMGWDDETTRNIKLWIGYDTGMLWEKAQAYFANTGRSSMEPGALYDFFDSLTGQYAGNKFSSIMTKTGSKLFKDDQLQYDRVLELWGEKDPGNFYDGYRRGTEAELYGHEKIIENLKLMLRDGQLTDTDSIYDFITKQIYGENVSWSSSNKKIDTELVYEIAFVAMADTSLFHTAFEFAAAGYEDPDAPGQFTEVRMYNGYPAVMDKNGYVYSVGTGGSSDIMVYRVKDGNLSSNPDNETYTKDDVFRDGLISNPDWLGEGERIPSAQIAKLSSKNRNAANYTANYANDIKNTKKQASNNAGYKENDNVGLWNVKAPVETKEETKAEAKAPEKKKVESFDINEATWNNSIDFLEQEGNAVYKHYASIDPHYIPTPKDLENGVKAGIFSPEAVARFWEIVDSRKK